MSAPIPDDAPSPAEVPPIAPATAGSLVRSSVVVGTGTALSRVTGFLRVSALAALGFDRLTDVYNVGNSTPNILYELLLGGILTATLVPLYVEHVERRDQRSSDAINTVALTALLVTTIVGIVVAPWIIDLYTIGRDDANIAAQRALATELLRWFMPQIFFYGVTALATAMLNARGRFAAAAFAPVLNNVVVIGVLLALPRLADGPLTVEGVLAEPALVAFLGLGTTLGIVAGAVVLLPFLRRAGARLRVIRDWRQPAVRRLLELSGWSVGYVIANQVAFWIVLVLSYRDPGDVSVYLAAFAIYQLPHGLFAVSIMTPLAPELARHATRGDLGAFRATYAAGVRLMALVIVPASVLMVVLARPIIDALLGYGDFTARSAALTADTLVAFTAGLLFFSVYLFTIRTFYARQDTRTPFFLNVGENVVNIVLAVLLVPSLGVQGLALSWSIAYLVGAIGALLVLHRRLDGLDARRTATSVGRIALAAAVAGVGAWAVGRVEAPAIVTVAVGGLTGGLLYLGCARLLQVPELGMLADALRRPSPARAPGTV